MKYLLTIGLLAVGIFGCKQNTPRDDSAGSELHALTYTLYTGKTEMFVEFKPLIVGQTSNFATHLTLLGDNFLPYTEGTVTVSLIQADKGVKNTADSPASPGIFRLALQPVQAGLGKLVFDIQTRDFTDQFIIYSIQVYAG